MSKRLGELQQLVAEKEAAEKEEYSLQRIRWSTCVYQAAQLQCISAGLKLLVSQALSYQCMKP